MEAALLLGDLANQLLKDPNYNMPPSVTHEDIEQWALGKAPKKWGTGAKQGAWTSVTGVAVGGAGNQQGLPKEHMPKVLTAELAPHDYSDIKMEPVLDGEDYV